MLEKRLFWEAGACSVTSAQLQDYILWIELIKRTHIHTLPEPLIKYRLRAGGGNLSQNPRFIARVHFEMRQVFRGMFDRLPREVFEEAFRDLIGPSKFTGELAYSIQKVLVYLLHGETFVREIGAEKLFKLMLEPEATDLLAQEYNFLLSDFLALTADSGFVSRKLMARAGCPN